MDLNDLLGDSLQRREPPQPTPLFGHVGLGVMGRSLRYNEPVGDVFNHQLQPHQRPFAVGEIAVQWYPGAHAKLRKDTRFLAHGGIMASFAHSVGGSTPIGTESFDTSYSNVNLGVRARIPFEPHEAGIQLGWGYQSLIIAGDNEQAFFGGQQQSDPGIVPDVSYSYLHFGPDARFQLWRLMVTGGLFLNLPSIGDDAGELKEERWFPNASATGWELDLGAELPLHKVVSVFFGTELRYFALSMNTNQAEAIEGAELQQAVAGGAADLYFTAQLGARLTLPGQR
jgi:hypothetical protein